MLVYILHIYLLRQDNAWHNSKYYNTYTMITTNQEQEFERLRQTTDPRILYKHSSTCLLSAKALKEIKIIEERLPDLPVLFLEVHTMRPFSNYIEQLREIRHESPQCILLLKWKPKQVMNHLSVTARQITHHLQWWRNDKK